MGSTSYFIRGATRGQLWEAMLSKESVVVHTDHIWKGKLTATDLGEGKVQGVEMEDGSGHSFIVTVFLPALNKQVRAYARCERPSPSFRPGPATRANLVF